MFHDDSINDVSTGLRVHQIKKVTAKKFKKLAINFNLQAVNIKYNENRWKKSYL